MADQKKTYALTPDENGDITAPKVRILHPIEKIYTLQSIDWGANHCVFVDKMNRVFTMG